MFFVLYCCNLKIAHLLRHLGPQILDYAHRFDAIIDQLNDDYYDLRLQSKALISLHDIPADLPSLSEAQMAQLARVQIRSLPSEGGLDLLPMREVAIPASCAAHLRHFRKLLQECLWALPFSSPSTQYQLQTPVFSPNPFIRPSSIRAQKGCSGKNRY
jgi:hypothetical protein